MLSEAKRQSLAELKGIKEKYVSTIKRMRDELAARKEDAWRSLETEWVKRRQAMNADWLRRLDNFKAHCEAHHPTCRCTSVVASLRRQNEALLNKAQDGMDARVQSVVAPTASGSRLVVPA
nr:hypothetical protein HK105_001269 [Polyrhizophydium stewartii]